LCELYIIYGLCKINIQYFYEALLQGMPESVKRVVHPEYTVFWKLNDCLEVHAEAPEG
jgi:hypothetical protein